jgi:hypothetical protein
MSDQEPDEPQAWWKTHRRFIAAAANKRDPSAGRKGRPPEPKKEEIPPWRRRAAKPEDARIDVLGAIRPLTIVPKPLTFFGSPNTQGAQRLGGFQDPLRTVSSDPNKANWRPFGLDGQGIEADMAHIEVQLAAGQVFIWDGKDPAMVAKYDWNAKRRAEALAHEEQHAEVAV